MSCNCQNTGSESTFVSRLGGSIVETPIPLSNGLNIPQQGVFRGYRDYYTVCRYLPAGQLPDIPAFVQLSKVSDTLNYFEELNQLGVVSFPTASLEFPEEFRVVSEKVGEWRVYPNASNDFYVLITHVVDNETHEFVEQHFNIELVGYQTNDASAFELPIQVVAGDKKVEFTVLLKNPYTIPSSEYVFLDREEGSHESIDIMSNCSWWFEL